MFKVKVLTVTAVVAVVAMLSSMALATTASAAARTGAPASAPTTHAASARPTVTPAVGLAIHSLLSGIGGIVLAAGTGVACVVEILGAGIAMAYAVDPTFAQSVITECDASVPVAATEVTQNAAGVGTALAQTLQDLPIIGNATGNGNLGLL